MKLRKPIFPFLFQALHQVLLAGIARILLEERGQCE